MKAGKEPAPSECGGGVLAGGDTGQSGPATAGKFSTTWCLRVPLFPSSLHWVGWGGVTSSGVGVERLLVRLGSGDKR